MTFFSYFNFYLFKFRVYENPYFSRNIALKRSPSLTTKKVYVVKVGDKEILEEIIVQITVYKIVLDFQCTYLSIYL